MVGGVAYLCHFHDPGGSTGSLEVQFEQVKLLQPVIQVGDGAKGPLVHPGSSAVVCCIQVFEAIRETGNKVMVKEVVDVIC